MPAHPPDSQFYDDVDNATLWRDLSRLFEDFVPRATSDERKERFLAVLSDIDGRLNEVEAYTRCEKMENQSDMQCVRVKDHPGNCSRRPEDAPKDAPWMRERDIEAGRPQSIQLKGKEIVDVEASSGDSVRIQKTDGTFILISPRLRDVGEPDKDLLIEVFANRDLS